VSTPFVVILTGGALPGQPTPDPAPADIEMAMTVAGVGAWSAPLDAHMARIAVGEALKIGWANAADAHQVVSVFVIGDDLEAARFAAFMSGEVDPAYVLGTRSPLPELLAHYEQTVRAR
jgi:hypothetical protein